MSLSPTEIYKGRNVFIIGATGFIGKVVLSMLLHRFPAVGRVYVTIRARSLEESRTRFWNNVITAPPFDPLRERYGSGFENFIKDKVEVLGGDICDPNLGYSEEESQRIANNIDIILNSAGNVTFNPTLESALRTNVAGTQNVIAFAKRMRRPALVHVSTCFVAGNRSGPIWESDSIIGYFPRKDELPGVKFSAEQEIRDCTRLAERVREETRDGLRSARFREQARQRLIEEGRDLDDHDTVNLAVARERKVWMRERLTELGIERAAWWGWPNIYTYTKSLGEQLIAAEEGIVRAIVRPSIVESAHSYPFPGWNEGFTTTAPLIFISLKGQTKIPVNEKLILDITPVDFVASVMIAVMAEAIVQQPSLVYQAATGDSNPNDMRRIVELFGLYKRKRREQNNGTFELLNEISKRIEPYPVTPAHFDRASAPMINAASRKVSSMLNRVSPRWGGHRLSDVVNSVKRNVDRVEEVTGETTAAFEMFRPFMAENAYVFRADNVRSLFSCIRMDEQQHLSWRPDKLDWFDYWLNIHVPGLEKWIFPKLEENVRASERRVYTYRDLVELFETSTKRYAGRVAMRVERDGRKEQYTYTDIRELATRAAAFFASQGVRPGNAIVLLTRDGPEWGITYFGVIKAGATCVHVDLESSTDEIINYTQLASARGIVLSPEAYEKHPELKDHLAARGLEEVQLWRLEDIYELTDEITEAQRTILLPHRIPAQSPASLVFTTGTRPPSKGALLSHKNLTSVASMLSTTLNMSARDGVVSVLPLYYAFEFSTGFITPFSMGAQILYFPTPAGSELTHAIQNKRATVVIAPPTAWEELHRQRTNGFNTNGKLIRSAVESLIDANGWLRNKTPFNLGHAIFRLLHNNSGGHMRILVNNGNNETLVNARIKRDMHGLGFTFLDSFGLPEASGVITLTKPQNYLNAVTVGKPLPGVEVKIDTPAENGIGEIMVRGANVSNDCFKEKVTPAALTDRWLHTGFLGYVDDAGNLYLVGCSRNDV